MSADPHSRHPPPPASRAARLTVFFLAGAAVVGLGATIYGLLAVESAIGPPSVGVLLAGVLVALSTCVNLIARFVRWHHLLRRLDVRLPTLPSLGAFAGSFAFLPIPLYLGQLVARTRFGLKAGRERGAGLLAFFWERTLDLWALSLLAIPALPPALAAAAGGLALALLIPAARRGVLHGLMRVAAGVEQWVSNEPGGIDAHDATRAAETRVFFVSAALSLASWLATCAALLPLAWAAGAPLGAAGGIGAAATSILAGALSLIPLGAGASGLVLFGELERQLAPTAAAALVVLIFRAATLWLTVGLGAIALFVHLRRSRAPAAHDHFDHIDECYDAWLPLHFRTHLVEKKIAAMMRRLDPARPGLRGLDVGCGRGWYLHELRRNGAEMVGVDTSARQLAASREYLGSAARLAQATVTNLPFAPASFDFAYIINVLHHLATPALQVEALREIAATVRPGGLVFVHEMNVVNPLFRFYLSYVFPILKSIEEGTEPYMDTRALPKIPELELETIEYFTFIPDFVPARLLPLAAPIERGLERSALLRPYAAHFMAVFRRV